MRILHVLDHSAPLYSGYVTRTLGVFAAQDAMGWTPLGLTTPRHERALRRRASAAPLEERAEGRRFLRTPDAGGGALGLIREMSAVVARINRATTEERPDLIHVHSPSINLLPALRSARKAGLPVVYEIRAFWEDAAVDAGRMEEGSARWRLQRAMELGAARRADAVALICEGLRNDFLARGFPADRAFLAPNAVDVKSFPPLGPRDRELEARLGLNGAPVIGFAGSFYPYEGLDLLIDAMPVIRTAAPGARLLLMGGGPEEAALRARAAPQGASVIFAGRLGGEELRRHYSLMDALVLPRRRMRLTELTTPLKPLEAMALGRAVVASDVGGHRELVKDGETGRLFAAGDMDALARAVAETLAAARSGALAPMLGRARAFVERERDWGKAGPRYAAIYAEAFRRAGRPMDAPLAAALKGA